MMKPEDRIKCRIIQLSHMSTWTTNVSMNTIMNILQTSLIARILIDQLMITESGEVCIIGIGEQDIDVLLDGSECRGHGLDDLILIGDCGGRGGVGWAAESGGPFGVLRNFQYD